MHSSDLCGLVNLTALWKMFYITTKNIHKEAFILFLLISALKLTDFGGIEPMTFRLIG